MAADTDEFHVWLCDHLRSLNLDEEVLGEYIAGILDTDDSNEEEKLQALSDTLEGMMDNPDASVSSDIFMKWKACQEEKAKMKKELENKKRDALLTAVMEKQVHAKKIENKKSSSQKVDVDVKKHVIAQYGQESDEEIYPSSDEESSQKQRPQDQGKGVFQNTNVSSVIEKQKERREKQKAENDERKLKIKQDREKQKEKVEQRKDKEKKRTQKGERRR